MIRFQHPNKVCGPANKHHRSSEAKRYKAPPQHASGGSCSLLFRSLANNINTVRRRSESVAMIFGSHDHHPAHGGGSSRVSGSDAAVWALLILPFAQSPVDL